MKNKTKASKKSAKKSKKEEEIEQSAKLQEESQEQKAEGRKEKADNKAEEVEDIASVDEAIEVIAQLKLKLRESEEEKKQLSERVLRLQADFDNFRKRKTKELADGIRFANQDLILQLLPILDNFDRTLKAIEGTDNLTAIKEGIELVSSNFRKQFSKIGVEPIDSIGKDFDSEIHEAITSIPVEEEEKKGAVVDEVEKGYKFKDRIIRFSKVIVGE
ncbi:MAG: nucleotide exchange factor GrpE [Bacteroidia bacterium]|nr:nucleotide exchange factor GrpE [Bacteroidia bacterium]